MPQLTLDQLFGRAPNKDKRPNDRDKKPGPATVKPAVARASPAPAPPPKKILFGPNGPHVDFDRSSPHPVKYKDLVYPTSQHLFQSFKFHRDHPDIAEQIRLAATAEQAFTIAHSNRESCRSDWSSVNLSKMEEALHLKFLQHPALRQELLGTANAELYQDSTNDVFWGVGSNLLGQNELGRALERVRERLGGAKAAVRKSVPCTNCHNKPRFGESLYCGDSCLRADINTIAPLCPECGRRPQIGKLGFCGETCKKKAAKRKFSGGK